MRIDKDLVQKAVDEAFDKIIKENESYDDSEVIYSDEPKPESKEKPEEDKVEKEENVEDKVEEEVEEAIGENSDFNFLGLDISIEKTENGKFNVKITKADKEKVEVLDAADLPNILGLIEDFFNELVLEDMKSGEGEEDEAESDEETSELDEEDDFDEDEPVEQEFEDELTEGYRASRYHTSLASLRRKYGSRVEEILEHGLLAKELALEMVRGNLVKGTVKELVDTVREKDALIAAKKTDLRKSSVRYLYAKKMESSLKKASAVLGSAIVDLSKQVNSRQVSPELARKAVKRYKSIIAAIVNANSPKTVLAATAAVGKVRNAVLANVNKSKIKPDRSRSVNTEFRPRNVLNRTGKTANSTLLSGRRYDGIDEMSAEILRIAGITGNS